MFGASNTGNNLDQFMIFCLSAEVDIFHINYWLAGDKIWWFAKKKSEFKGEEVEKGEIFTVLVGKNIILEKAGGG